MTTMFRRDVTCANCGKSSEHQLIGSTNAFGSSDLDLRPPEMQRSTMWAWVQECPHCHYVAGDLGRSEGDRSLVSGAEYLGVLNDMRFPKLARQFLAQAFLAAGTDPESAGHARLHAAWSCDDAGKVDLAVECRRLAADDLARSKPFADSQNGLTRGALLVDVLRRSEQFEVAAAECDYLLEYAAATEILRQVLELQARLIAARDAGRHTVSEATK